VTTVLVTGTGAIIGYGILKSLRQVPGVTLVAADIFAHAAGQYFADRFVQAPPTRSPDYADWLAAVVRDHGIDLIIPGIEQDVTWLAAAVRAGTVPGCAIALNNPALIALAGDKIAFDHFLRQSGDPARIPGATEGDFAGLAQDLGVPFLLKPRHGYAGKGILRIADAAGFAPHADRLGDVYLAQKIIGDDDAEYTVSAFCRAGAVLAAIALQRHLSPEGATLRARTTDAAPFLPAMTRLARSLGAEGPTNFQFRIADGQPWLMEINPRISSATSLRAAFGYNEAQMCLDHYLFRRPVTQPALRPGHAIRYIEDIIRHDDCPDR
jgi:carbamoyl-phosphate synthase large subunit